jgi:transposase-like protein
MEERGVNVDHATLNRWVIDYSPLIAAEANFVRRLMRLGLCKYLRQNLKI